MRLPILLLLMPQIHFSQTPINHQRAVQALQCASSALIVVHHLDHHHHHTHTCWPRLTLRPVLMSWSVQLAVDCCRQSRLVLHGGWTCWIRATFPWILSFTTHTMARHGVDTVTTTTHHFWIRMRNHTEHACALCVMHAVCWLLPSCCDFVPSMHLL
jgi:hypothetical protein